MKVGLCTCTPLGLWTFTFVYDGGAQLFWGTSPDMHQVVLHARSLSDPTHVEGCSVYDEPRCRTPV